MMAWIVVLFWIVGVATGIVSAIFLLELEDRYIFQPIKSFTAEIKNGFTKIVSNVLVSSRRAFRIFSTSGAKVPVQKM